MPSNPEGEILSLLAQAKSLAQRYRALTGKPLGITGEIAEYEAAHHLGLQLTPARTAGYDAQDPQTGKRYQIKGRCLLPGCKPGQRLGSIDIAKNFDAVLLVLLDQDFETISIHESDREAVIAALTVPGSRARNERGSLSVNKFRSIGKKIWPADG